MKSSNKFNTEIGTAVIDRYLIRSLRALWEGPFTLEDVWGAEQALRAFLVSPALAVLRGTTPYWLGRSTEVYEPGDEDFNQPFDDHLLDYEFAPVEKPIPVKPLLDEESTVLERLIEERIRKQAAEVVPRTATNAEAYGFLDAWYRGYSPKECEENGKLYSDGHYPHPDGGTGAVGIPDKFNLRPFVDTEERYHPIFHRTPQDFAHYIVGLHRSGYSVFSRTPVARACEEFVFSVWPMRLFELFGEEYEEHAKLLRGPGCSLSLPPVLNMVLSRSDSRDDIPLTIRDMREEYSESRTDLWSLLSSMFTESNLHKQLKVLREIDKASKSIFKAAFPEENILRLAPGLVGVALGNPAQLIKDAIEVDSYRKNVQGVSFTNQLAADAREYLVNSTSLVRRHFTDAEIESFGAKQKT